MNLQLDQEQQLVFETFVYTAGFCSLFSFIACLYLLFRHKSNWVNEDIQMPTIKIVCFNFISSLLFLIMIMWIDYYSWIELIYEILLSHCLYIFFNQLAKTLVAYEMKVRYENNEDPEFFNLIRKEDPTAYITFIKSKDITEHHYKELCFAMALRKVEKGTIIFIIDQSFDNMTHAKNKVVSYNNVVWNWVLLTILTLFVNILLNHMIGYKVLATLYLLRFIQFFLESYLILVLIMISQILSEGTNNQKLLSNIKRKIFKNDIERYNLQKTQTYCFCFKTKSKEYKEKIEDITYHQLSILRKTSLEWKFVSIKLLPGIMCSLTIGSSIIPINYANFQKPIFENLLVFLICSILNSILSILYIYAYDIDKFDFKRYEDSYIKVTIINIYFNGYQIYIKIFLLLINQN